MGVPLTPIIVKDTPRLSDLAARRLAVDGNGDLYQFLALIRLRDGAPLMDSRGRITSHLVGLFYRTTRLIAEHGLQLIYVFDGRPPALKASELKLVQQHGRIEHMPPEIRAQVPAYDDVRAIFLNPDVAVAPDLVFREPDEGGIVRFLCEEHEFSRERVTAALARMRRNLRP